MKLQNGPLEHCKRQIVILKFTTNVISQKLDLIDESLFLGIFHHRMKTNGICPKKVAAGSIRTLKQMTITFAIDVSLAKSRQIKNYRDTLAGRFPSGLS